MKRNHRVSSELNIIWGQTPCYYCGQLATDIDHIPPQVARSKLFDLGFMDRYPIHELPCCRECNSILGDRLPWTLNERRAYVKKRLRERYRKFLEIPDWTDSELAILRPTLQEFVICGLVQKERIEARLKW
jgi:hypothetical protein